MTKTRTGMWRCRVCDAFGTGGVEAWERHYFQRHFVPAVGLDGRESSPRHYGEA